MSGMRGSEDYTRRAIAEIVRGRRYCYVPRIPERPGCVAVVVELRDDAIALRSLLPRDLPLGVCLDVMTAREAIDAIDLERMRAALARTEATRRLRKWQWFAASLIVQLAIAAWRLWRAGR